jgi:hypothetical protein
MNPPSTTAASLVPSFDEAIERQFLDPADGRSVQVFPEFVEV